MADGIMDFFSKEAGQARTKARDEFIDGILGAARRAADYYLGPTGIPDRASSAGRVAAEMNPVVGIMDAMQASGEGRYGDAALETAMALAPAYGVTKAARPVSEAVQEVLLGGSAAAGDAGRAFVERMNQRGPMPTVYSNPFLTNVEDYVGSHRAPRRDPDFARSSLDDPRDIFGGDDSIYSREAKQYYGTYGPQDDESIKAIQVARGNPDAEITVYRAIPKDIDGGDVNPGDWVTPSRTYAEIHGEGPLGGDYKIIEKKVRAGDLFTEGDIHEWGYDPAVNGDTLPEPRNEAEAMAKRILDMRASGNAADVTDEMMAQADPQYMFYNTPLPMDEASRMERAREMGLLDDTYHATGAEFQQFIPSQVGRHGAGVYTGKSVSDVQTFLPKDEVTRRSAEGSMVLPLRIPDDAQMASEMKWQDALPERWNYGDPKDVNDAISGYAEAADTLSRMGFKGVEQPATDWDGRVIFDPRNIRSRFARFDPAFEHLKNLSAATGIPVTGLLGYSMLQDEQQ